MATTNIPPLALTKSEKINNPPSCFSSFCEKCYKLPVITLLILEIIALITAIALGSGTLAVFIGLILIISFIVCYQVFTSTPKHLLDRMRQQITEARNLNKQLTENVSSLNQEITNLKETNTQIQKDLDTKLEEFSVLNNNLTIIENWLSSDISESQKNTNKLSEALKELQHISLAKKEELNEAQGLHKQSCELVQSLIQMCISISGWGDNDIRNQVKTTHTGLTTEVASLQQTRGQLQNEVTSLRLQIAEQKRLVTEQKQLLEQQKQAVAELQKEILALKEQVISLRNTGEETEVLNQQLETLITKFNELTKTKK